MSFKLSRRQLAAALLAASTPAPAQTESPQELLREARRNASRAGQELAGFKIAFEVEPAFQFKA